MTNAEKKKILNSYRAIDRQIGKLEERAALIRDDYMMRSPNLDGLPKGSGSQDLADYAARIDESYKKIKELIKAKYEALDMITDEIEKLPRENEKLLLRLRYIEGYTFERVAVEMSYSWRHTLRIHADALSHFMEG